jgi:hypothetical protein
MRAELLEIFFDCFDARTTNKRYCRIKTYPRFIRERSVQPVAKASCLGKRLVRQLQHDALDPDKRLERIAFAHRFERDRA